MQSLRLLINKYPIPPKIQLALIFLASLLIYILAFLLPINLLKLYARPRLDVNLLFSQGVPAYIRLMLAFIGVSVLYWLGYKIVSKLQDKATWSIVIFGMLAFMTVFLFIAPFDAADIYDNIMHGRILGVHQANPFQQVIANYPNDPFHDYAAWKKARSAYGPLWELLAGFTAGLAGDGIIANVLAFKLLSGTFHLAGVAVVVLYLRQTAPEQALGGALLLGWNPLMLYETWGNGHNDVAMAFWFLVAAWWILRRHYTLAVLSLMVGALIKFIPILLIPAVLLIGWRNLQTTRERLLFLVNTTLLSSVITVSSYYPFWNGFATLSFDRRTQMFSASIPAMIFQFLKPTLGLNDAAQLVSLSALGLLSVFVIFQSFRVNEKEASHNFSQTAFYILAFYLLITCLWFQQWYSLWLVCLAPLLLKPHRRLAILFSFWVVTKQLMFSRIFVSTMFFKPETAIYLTPLHTIAVLGVPWIYALWVLQTQRKRKENYV